MRGRGVSVLIIFLATFLAALMASPAFSQVSGPCANCHTMHNSQNAEPMAYAMESGSFVPDTTANQYLLISDCIGCHSATDGTSWQEAVTGAPIVFNVVEPQYGADAGDGKKQGLAGGNFYWVTQDDAFGHNIFSSDPELDEAPGNLLGSCGTNSCHLNLDRPYGGEGFAYLAGLYACTACHMKSGSTAATVTHWHHADDSATVVNSSSQGWYRFLSGHMSGDGHGAAGIEDSDWEHSPTSTDHNEYLGVLGNKGGGGMGANGNTVTAFCSGCHTNFHAQDTTATGVSPWIRHPSDQTLPNSGEYTGYTVYDPLVPVARPSLSAVSGVVSPGTDMVMCLSCHRAHASPYYKMLRWDIKNSDLSVALSGCVKCHTSKN